MDEQTRQARFESMRKAPGLRKLSSNKKLFIVHKDLQKQCDRIVKRHEFDVRINTALVRREQSVMERHLDKLFSQQKRFALKREKTHVFLDKLEQSHLEREKTIRSLDAIDQQKIRPRYIDVIRSINNLSMPNDMKERLCFEYTTNPVLG